MPDKDPSKTAGAPDPDVSLTKSNASVVALQIENALFGTKSELSALSESLQRSVKSALSQVPAEVHTSLTREGRTPPQRRLTNWAKWPLHNCW